MPEPQPAEVVDAINDIAGAHPGHRAAHAKGTLCAGTFRATRAAAKLTRAAHMQGRPVRATVRFSNGGGNPAKWFFRWVYTGVPVRIADGWPSW